MAAGKAKTKGMNIALFKKKPKVSRPGVHAKTKHSNSKRSKLYKKLSRGQG